MAVLQMQRISIFGLKKGRKSVLEFLQRRGMVEVTDLDLDGSVFTKTDTAAMQSLCERNMQAAAQALEILQTHAPEDKQPLAMLNGRTKLSVEDYNKAGGKVQATMEKALDIVALSKKIAENETEALRLEAQKDALIPWLPLDVSMRIKGTKSTGAFVGSFPARITPEELSEGLTLALPKVAVHLEEISGSVDQTCVFVLCGKNDALAVEEALRNMGFTYPSAPSKKPPQELDAALTGKILEAKQAAKRAKEDICANAGLQPELRFAVDYFTLRTDKYRLLGRLEQSRHTFVVTGYAAKRDAPAFAEQLSREYGVAVELEDLPPEEEAPVLLHNNAFASPVEPVLESYSLPARGEVDPCSVMAVFYYVLFGMMLSDAAYGLIMVLVCGFVLMKFKNLEPGMHKAVKMFFFCGFSTIFWGVMFASYFGDAIEVVAKTFFNTPLVIHALWFRPVEEPMRLLVFCFLLGIIHLFTGLALAFYQLAKQKRWLDAIYDVVFWYMLVGGGIVFMLSTTMVAGMLGLTFTLSATAGTVGAVLACIGAVGIVLTAGRESRSPVKRLLKGLYGLYNVSGYLSDILSYSRLLALGLATGVIASVFNQMGAMAGGGVVGAIAFTIVFIVGHTMNIGINLLGAYVHTNRLQYVEFFGKFYNGGGRKFEPFAVKTKYYKFEEESSHGH